MENKEFDINIDLNKMNFEDLKKCTIDFMIYGKTVLHIDEDGNVKRLDPLKIDLENKQ